MLVFSGVIDDFVLVDLLSTNASNTPMSVIIYSTQHGGNGGPALNALGTIMLVMSLVIAVIGYLGYRWMTRGERGSPGRRADHHRRHRLRRGIQVAGGHIQLVTLTKRFTEVAVDGIDLSVDSGEFFSLLGPSGCGKTTTLRLIAGFEQPTAGRILLDGTDMGGVPPHKRNVNTVFQSYALFPFLSVFDNVAFGLRYQQAA